MPILASSCRRDVVEGQAGHEQRHREADAGEHRDADQLRPACAPVGRRPRPRRAASHEAPVMPTVLPTTRPTSTPTVTGSAEVSRLPVMLDAGVGQREQRDDQRSSSTGGARS